MYLTTITGQVIRISPNKSKRTFTIRKNGLKYRTYPVDAQEFREMSRMTGNDWQNFLKSNDYYKV